MKACLFVSFLFAGLTAAAQIPSPEVQIKLATLAAPAEMRDKALVYGYNQKGELVVLRKGENEMICLGDDPNQAGLSVSCYHKDLEPFMARGRELKKEGKKNDEVFTIREQEVKAGKLVMPKSPSTLYVYSAKDDQYDKTTGEVKDGYLRYVIYIPYATAESTGLPLQPSTPGMPWIMDPGTHRAHIMINPAQKN
ncbi:hypothetical protein SAMN04488109_1502 [Chryseolinea serpens]|uniref:Uncharacterized protein n=1 Tax=Chryseolinea serpens TaxID=947013 RepID=A0A1M5M0W0_9BACT|nr:hypothetical protein [Chryseolinea serpens]SHG70895.1 hypothetical protein SAMN04488109_1502 [Chryseolinea serpens]